MSFFHRPWGCFWFLISVFLFSAFPQSSYGQDNEIEKLEQEIEEQKGSSYVVKAVNLGELYLQDGQIDKGVSWLRKATREARRQRISAMIAQVNKSVAEIILAHAPPDKKYIEEAFKAVQTSLKEDIVSIEDENLSLLRSLYNAAGDGKLGDKIQEEIGQVVRNREEADKAAEEKEDVQAFREFRKMNEKEQFEDFNRLSEEREKLAETIGDLANERMELEKLNEVSRRRFQRTTQQLEEVQITLDSTKEVNDSILLAYYQQITKNQQAQLELQLTDIRLKENQLRNQELEIENRKRGAQNMLFLVIALIILIISGGLYMRYRETRNHNLALAAKNEIIEEEKERSERLLLNILPVMVAEELKKTGRASTRSYQNVTILFTDFKDFTSMVASMSPETLVYELNDIFGHFDDIMDEFQIEKIETIGDAYLAACGLPQENEDHAARCVAAAKKMISYLAARNEKNDIKWEMRVGIHSGPVVAGVVGKKKFAYDIFGDTVNTASRMESNGKAGKVNISMTTYELIKETYECTHRGKIHSKGKGELDMYFVS
jgi:class 3 adenylate cyclase